MSDVSGLRGLQGLMVAAITRSDDFANDECLDGVVRSAGRLTGTQRLDIYRRSHRARLLEALRGAYQGLRHMLGDDLFDAFASDFLSECPPGGYALQRLGDGFPDHLAATRPAGDDTWPDLLIEMARLERAFAEVYDGPGAEGAWLPRASDLPRQRDAGWEAVAVEPVPCLRLFRSSHPVGPYLAGIRRGEDPALPSPSESFLALSRTDYVVTLTPLDAREHEALERLMRGESLGAAASAAGLAPDEAWRLVRRWADNRFFRSLGAPTS